MMPVLDGADLTVKYREARAGEALNGLGIFSCWSCPIDCEIGRGKNDDEAVAERVWPGVGQGDGGKGKKWTV